MNKRHSIYFVILLDYAKQHDLSDAVCREIVGHSKGSDAHSSYQHAFSIAKLKEYMDKVDYGIKISAIKVWE